MDVPDIFIMARELSHTNATDFPDTRLLPFLDRVKDDFHAYLITGAGEDWNWDIWTTPSFLNQTEYVIPEAASDTEGNLKISGVSINYNGDTYEDGRQKYIPAKEVRLPNLRENWNYYINKQPKECPLFYVADKSIFIAPTVKDTPLTTGIELKGIRTIANYTVITTELNTKIPIHLHMVLVQGLLPFIHRAEGRKKDAITEQQVYERDRDLAVDKFKNRATGPHFLSYPHDSDGRSEEYILDLT